jgi:hypothetical protein
MTPNLDKPEQKKEHANNANTTNTTNFRKSHKYQINDYPLFHLIKRKHP